MEKTIRAEPFQADKMGHLFLMEREFQGSLSRGESAVEGSEGGTKGGWRLGRPGEEAGREKPPYWNREGLPSGQQRAKWQPMMTQAPPLHFLEALGKSLPTSVSPPVRSCKEGDSQDLITSTLPPGNCILTWAHSSALDQVLLCASSKWPILFLESQGAVLSMECLAGLLQTCSAGEASPRGPCMIINTGKV